ncbi:putative pumilio homolog 7, chloroplastic [Impatiens glandulifera]|uniref:putative pumilio homolog 7, chloroplastic n=1 Tax=Impatiens glandulifera TaxID=253017 RepID=UPI001FB0F728|nr:putative pumilio homolog 7, chloroplastic [Impatiens glandulifera]
MMFQGRPVQKGKSVVVNMDGGRGDYETIWNLNHQMNHRQFDSFDGSEYFSGGGSGRFRNDNDETLYSVMMKNRYDLNEFDLCNQLREMHVGNGSTRFGESSYSRANSFVSNPNPNPNPNPMNLSINQTENPYLVQKDFLSRSHYQLQNDNDLGAILLRRQNGVISKPSSSSSCSTLFKMDGSDDSLVLEGNLSDHHHHHRSSCLPNSNSPVQYQNYIYVMAKDQQGCRFLQRRLGEETQEGVQILFNEIIGHIVELMMDPFGNYLVQKLLEICDEEQLLKIVLMVTEIPGDLVRVSLNAHGTRAVQKLIETIKTRQQISLVIMALKPGFLDLVKDPNGNHVIQLCLEQFNYEDNKFIFSAAERFCVAIATHQHGCCVMNRCIAHSVGRDRENLIAKVASNGLKLAQDAFGNYVVQYVIELKIPSVASILMSQFEGNFCALSTQKFSSHVIEKCLKFIEYSRPRIVNELLNAPRFDQLLQDPFANYVIRSALDNTNPKGNVHVSLKKAVNSYPSLRMSPYCKKIFSHNRAKT